MKTLYLLFAVLSLSNSLYSQFQWEHTGGPEGLGSSESFYNKDYAFLYDGLQLYRTGDGQSWELINTYPSGKIIVGERSISIYTEKSNGLDNPKEIQFLFSYDNGDSWNSSTVPQDAYYNENQIMLCTHGIYFKAGQKLYRSQSNGQSWKQLSYENISFSSIFTADDKIWGRSGDKIYEFNSQSSRWLFSWNMPNSSSIESIHINESYIIVKAGNKFFSSINKGNNWTNFAASTNAIGILAEKGNKVYFQTAQVLRFTEKGNNTWNIINLNKQYQNICVVKDKLLLFSSSGGCVLFDDTSNTYLPANQGIKSSGIFNLWAGQNKIWAHIRTDSSFQNYDETSGLWSSTLLRNSYDPDLPLLISSSGYLLFKASNSGKLIISTTQGITHDTLHLPYSSVNGVKNLFWIGDYIYLEGSSSHYISSDFGATWNQVPKLLSSAVIFRGQIWACDNSGDLVVSSDMGISWVEIDTEWENILMLFMAEDRIFAIIDSEPTALYSSADGIKWKYSGDGIAVDTRTSGFASEKEFWKQNGIYYFLRASRFLFYSTDNCSSWEKINLNLSQLNIVVLNDTIYLGSGDGGGVFKSKMPRLERPSAKGSIFHDLNGNGIKEPNESYLNNVQIMVSTGTDPKRSYFTLSNQEGQFEIKPSAESNDTLRPNLLSEYIESIEPPFYITQDSVENYEFAVRFRPDVIDNRIAGKFNIQPRPGKALSTHIIYENNGTVPISGTVGLKLDPEFSFASATPAPSEIIRSDSLVWNFTDMPISTSSKIVVEGNVTASIPNGNLFTMAASINTSGIDVDMSDNHIVIQDTLVHVFIPNQKSVFPAEGMTVEDMLEGKELEYTIRFQNPYEYVVNSVQISDALSTFLDYTSIRITGSSHDISSWELLPSGILRVFFDNMNLAPNSLEDQRSQGFLSFAIRIRKDNNPTFNFTNKANIIFEKTRAVATNTVNTKMIEDVISSTEEFIAESHPKLIITPNPTSDNCIISTNNTLEGPGTLKIFDLNGRVLYMQKVQDLRTDILLQTDQLFNGYYLITAEGVEGIMHGKLIIQK